MPKKALLMVDLQNDFCGGGSLAVPGAESLIPIANQLQNHFDIIIASQDWHPAAHLGFATTHAGQKPGDVIDLEGVVQILWPDHCVQNTFGAAFHPDLDTTRITHIVFKGQDPHVDSYSAFFDNAHRHSTGLSDWLRAHDVTDLYVMGIATDYCVLFTCLDAIAQGFRVHLLPEACRAVNLKPGDAETAIQDMLAAGVISQSIKSVG